MKIFLTKQTCTKTKRILSKRSNYSSRSQTSTAILIMSTTDILSVRDQIQEDLTCLLATQFDDEGQMDEVQRIACQIVVDNFNKLR